MITQNKDGFSDFAQSLIDNLDIGIVEHSLDGAIVNFNFKALELFGLSNSEKLEKSMDSATWSFLDENGYTLAIEKYPESIILSNKLPIKDKIYGISRANHNDIKWVSVSGFLICELNGEISKIIISYIDVTSCVIAKSELTSKNIALEQQCNKSAKLSIELQNLIDLLDEAKRKSDESEKLKTAFLNNLSHELRTPLNGLLGLSEIIIHDKPEIPEKEELIQMMRTCSDRLTKTIENAVLLSQLETGLISVDFKEFSLKELLEDVYLLHISTANQKKLEFKLIIDDESSDLTIISDRYFLDSILANLIDNAFKFTDTGKIELGANCIKDKLIIFVNDTGIGIPNSFYNNIFEKFCQYDYTNSRIYEGCGIGLSIAKGLSDLINFKIEFESKVGMGSSFRLVRSAP